MAYISAGAAGRDKDSKQSAEGAVGGDKESQLSAMLSSPSAGGMRLAGNYAQRGSPGVVRRTASRPISIIRSTSVPAQLQDRTQAGEPDPEGGSGGNPANRRGLHTRDRSLQHDFNSGAAGGVNGIVQSLPPPQAPLLAGSLPPSRFLDDLPPLSLGPQADNSFDSDCGALSTSLKANRLYATSCPANIGAHFGRPPGSKLQSMSVLAEGPLDEEEEEAAEEGTEASKRITALSILESLSQTPAAPVDGSRVDAESVESLTNIVDERLPIEDDVFELDGLEGVNEELEALSLPEAGSSNMS
ncbi:unnamed protein product [Ectocarpus sp. 6 AP-2014]